MSANESGACPPALLEYRAARRQKHSLWFGVASGYYVGAFVGVTVASVGIILISGGGDQAEMIDSMVTFFLPITAVMLLIPALCIAGAMRLWGRLTQRYVYGWHWGKSFIVSGIVSAAFLFVSAFLPEKFMNGPVGYLAYNFVGELGAPLAMYLLMSRKFPDIDAST